MPLMIYQIGDMPLFFDLTAKADDNVSVKGGRSWDAPTTEFTGVSGEHTFADPARPLAKSQSLSIDGYLVCQDGKSADKIFRKLMSLGGIPQLPVIGFRYEECDHNDIGCCANCNPTLDWIINYGIITSIDQTSEYHDTQRPWSSMTIPVSMQMTVGPKWKILTGWEWEYRRNSRILNPLSTAISEERSNNTFVIPSSIRDLSREAYFFRWGLSLSQYDPSFWGIKYSEGRKGGIGSNYQRSFGTYAFNSDPSIWNAAPNSIYAFTLITNGTGTLKISVKRGLGYSTEVVQDEESTLNLATLNSDMIAAGHQGLFETDTLITGYASPFPGFVIRDGTILANVRPRWSYPGLYPGETGTGYNEVTFSGVNVHAHSAYLHDFGVY